MRPMYESCESDIDIAHNQSKVGWVGVDSRGTAMNLHETMVSTIQANCSWLISVCLYDFICVYYERGSTAPNKNARSPIPAADLEAITQLGHAAVHTLQRP